MTLYNESLYSVFRGTGVTTGNTPPKIERTTWRAANQARFDQGSEVFTSEASPCEMSQCSYASSVIGSRRRASLKFGLLTAVDTGQASRDSDGTGATLSMADFAGASSQAF